MQFEHKQMNNIQIIENIRKGDLKTFESVFRDNYDELCNYAMRFTRDFDLAEEFVQDIFYRIWKKHSEIIITTSLQSYLFQCVKNHCLQHIKHKEVEKRYAERVQSENLSTSYEPEVESQVEEISLTIDETLRAMPDKCREIFVLSRYDGLKYQEIADKLSISIKTVEANMGKALKMFRESLGKFAGTVSA